MSNLHLQMWSLESDLDRHYYHLKTLTPDEAKSNHLFKFVMEDYELTARSLHRGNLWLAQLIERKPEFFHHFKL